MEEEQAFLPLSDEEEEHSQEGSPDFNLWNWPRPIPRYWAYTRLLQNKLFAKMFGNIASAPSRINPELPFMDRYWYHFWSADPTQIVNGLFLGSAKNAADSAGLERNGISTVVNVTTEIENFFDGRNHQLQYINVPLDDTKEASIEDVEERFITAVDAIRTAIEEGGSVLVHCFMGASRSVALVCAYFIKHQGMSFDEAYQMIKDKRPCAALNENFYTWLKEL